MGSVLDYYRPGADESWCGMFTSTSSKHEFSRDGVTWVTPAVYSGAYGGSTEIPDASLHDDDRSYLSFWGHDSSQKGGCCHTSYTDGAAWGRAFTIVMDAV